MKKKLVLTAFYLLSGLLIQGSETFLILKNSESYNLTVIKSSKPHRTDEFYDVSIKLKEKVIENFTLCKGDLVTKPERGIYRIYCKNKNSTVLISGRFLENPDFRAYWTNNKGIERTFN